MITQIYQLVTNFRGGKQKNNFLNHHIQNYIG